MEHCANALEQGTDPLFSWKNIKGGNTLLVLINDMRINIKLSASYSAASGMEEFSIDLSEGSTVDQLIKQLSENYSDLHLDRKETMVVINDRIANRDQVLNDNEKAMIFHLFAGG